METIKIKDFTGSCFGLFMEGEFVCSDDWQADAGTGSPFGL